MIVKSLNQKKDNILKDKCEKVSSIKEGEEIAVELFKELKNSETAGIGLSANQIGINKRVCVVNVKEPIYLINPEIVERSDESFVFLEGCLSFPNHYIKTMRHKRVVVKADNFDDDLIFDVESLSKEDNPAVDKTRDEIVTECACIQHEIDHLDGITMFDKKFVQKPVKRAYRKIGRNEKVLIKKDSQTKQLKWKKAEPYMEDGWALVEIL